MASNEKNKLEFSARPADPNVMTSTDFSFVRKHWYVGIKSVALYMIFAILTSSFTVPLWVNWTFSILLLIVSVISKLAGCGLGAKLCGFSGRESVQVGMGMVCRGEVALIVANRGLSMGVLSAAMMTPVVITVVGGTILTPILLKLAFRGEAQEKLVESRLADRYEKTEQLEDASQQLLDADAALRKETK